MTAVSFADWLAWSWRIEKAEALAVADQDAVRSRLAAGLGQQGLGPSRVVGVRLHAGVERPARRRELSGGERRVPLQHFLMMLGTSMA